MSARCGWLALFAALMLAVGCKSSTQTPTPEGAPESPPASGAPVEPSIAVDEAPFDDQLFAAAEHEEPGRIYLVEHATRDLWIETSRPGLSALLDRAPTSALIAAARERALTSDGEAAAIGALVASWHGEDIDVASSLADPRPGVRAFAATTLGVQGSEAAARVLAAALPMEAIAQVQAAIAHALGLTQSAAGIEALALVARTRAVGLRNMGVRQAAVMALGRIGRAHPAAVGALTPFLATPIESELREAAATALGSTLQPDAVPPLVDALALAPSQALLRRIDDALKLLTFGGGPPSVGMGGRGTQTALELWDAWWKANREAGVKGWREAALARTFTPSEGFDPLGAGADSSDLIVALSLLLESTQSWQRRLAHESLNALAAVIDEHAPPMIHPRALYDPDVFTTEPSFRAVAEWQAWARR